MKTLKTKTKATDPANEPRDVIREHHEEAAARVIRRPWDGLDGEAKQAAVREWATQRDARKGALDDCIRRGAPPPYTRLLEALFAARDYPEALGEIGLHDPALRESPVVRKAVAAIEAHFREARRILLHAARVAGAETAVAVEIGLDALRTAYAPDPTGYGTATGIGYNRGTWPDCMEATDWAQLAEPIRGDLARLRDALARLNCASAERPATATNPAPYMFRRDGDFWALSFEGREQPRVRHLAGMTYIKALLCRPGEPIPCRDLYEIENPRPPDARTDGDGGALAAEYGTGGRAQRMIEGATEAELKRALAGIREMLNGGDLSEHERDGLEGLADAIEQALANRGDTFEPKDRKGPRQAVCAAIARAEDAVANATNDRELVRHLHNAITKPKFLWCSHGFMMHKCNACNDLRFF